MTMRKLTRLLALLVALAMLAGACGRGDDDDDDGGATDTTEAPGGEDE